jgi:hypothetical protein
MNFSKKKLQDRTYGSLSFAIAQAEETTAAAPPRKIKAVRDYLSGIKKILTHIATHQFHVLEIKTS